MSSLHFLGMVVITGLTNSFQLCKQMVAQVAELIFHGWSSPEDVYDFLRQVSVVMVVAQLVFGSRSQTQVVDVYVLDVTVSCCDDHSFWNGPVCMLPGVDVQWLPHIGLCDFDQGVAAFAVRCPYRPGLLAWRSFFPGG